MKHSLCICLVAGFATTSALAASPTADPKVTAALAKAGDANTFARLLQALGNPANYPSGTSPYRPRTRAIRPRPTMPRFPWFLPTAATRQAPRNLAAARP
jgi:hypothetical protein